MPKPVLPEHLREQITTLITSGMSTIDIYDMVTDDSAIDTESEEQVLRCISSIRGKVTFNNKNIKPVIEKIYNIPSKKNFDSAKHNELIGQLNRVMMENKFESLCEPVVSDILLNFEGFKKVESAAGIPGFYNPPFGFLAYKGKTPYIIECKESLNSFSSPCETQKRRIKELMSHFEGLKFAFIQVRINTGEYRIFYNNETNLFFDGRKVSIAPVVEWIDNKLNEAKTGD